MLLQTLQCFLEGFQVSPVRPSDNSGIEMQMSVKVGGMILTEETEVLGEKPVPLSEASHRGKGTKPVPLSEA
jgi:hypothetical protein